MIVRKKIIDYSNPGFWGNHYLLATSKFSAGVLSKAFGVSEDRVIISGYPRNYEPITDKPIKYVSKKEREYLIKIKNTKEQGYTIIGYFPTFRDRNRTLMFGTQNRDELQELFSYFKKMNIKLVGKFHFAGRNDNAIEIYSHEYFINLPSDTDVYTFLSEIDILITDYSSIYFDYLLWGKPIVFFPYDLKYYCNKDRGLMFDYEELTPGPKVYDIRGLMQLLSNGVEEFTNRYDTYYSKTATVLKEKIFGNSKDVKINHTINHLIDQIRALML